LPSSLVKRAGGRNQHRCWIKKLRLVSAPDDQPSALVYPSASIGLPVIEPEAQASLTFINIQLASGFTN